MTARLLLLLGQVGATELEAAIIEAVERTAAGSRLINGNLRCHEALESELAEFFGSESSLVSGNGYMLNLGVIPAPVGEGESSSPTRWRTPPSSMVPGFRARRSRCSRTATWRRWPRP